MTYLAAWCIASVIASLAIGRFIGWANAEA